MPDKGTSRRIAAGVAGTALAAALLVFCLRRADVRQVAAALTGLSFVALLPALACEASVQLGKALKWTCILRSSTPVRYSSALSAVVIGAASTHLVPLRLDEVLRAAVLGRREQIDSAHVLGTVAVDRAIEVLVAGVLLGAIALFGGLEGWLRTGAQILWFGLFTCIVLGILFLRAEDAIVERLSRSRWDSAQRVVAGLRGFASGLASLPRGRLLAGVALGSVVEWAATVGFYAWLLHVFGISSPGLGGLGLPLLLALGNTVAYAVPNVPGAIGTFEAVQSSLLFSLATVTPADPTLAPAAITAGTAMAVALAAHGVLMIPVTVVGSLLALFEWRRPGASTAA